MQPDKDTRSIDFFLKCSFACIICWCFFSSLHGIIKKVLCDEINSAFDFGRFRSFYNFRVKIGITWTHSEICMSITTTKANNCELALPSGFLSLLLLLMQLVAFVVNDIIIVCRWNRYAVSDRANGDKNGIHCQRGYMHVSHSTATFNYTEHCENWNSIGISLDTELINGDIVRQNMPSIHLKNDYSPMADEANDKHTKHWMMTNSTSNFLWNLFWAFESARLTSKWMNKVSFDVPYYWITLVIFSFMSRRIEFCSLITVTGVWI